jgi:hypothetical protein
VFVESGAEIVRHFDLDSAQLDSIINEGVDDDLQVETDDIQLMAMLGAQGSYARLSLRRLQDGDGAPVGDAGDDSVGQSLRRLLYKKYGYWEKVETPANSDGSTYQRRKTDPPRRQAAALPRS